MTLAIADLGLAVRNIHGSLDIPDNGRGGTVRYLAPEYLTDSVILSRFVSFVNMDIYAMSLCIWEICRRTETGSGKKPPSAQLPYFEYMERDPSIEEMKKCVCDDKNRPCLLPEWENHRVSQNC